MATIRWEETTAVKTVLNTATQGTTLNALANAARAITNSTGDIANQTNLDFLADFELLVDIQSAPALGDKVAELYLLPSVDGTTFPDGSTSITPQTRLLADIFEARQAITGDLRMVVPSIPLSPRITRALLINTSGAAFGANDGHTLKAQAYRLQSV